MLLQFTFGNFRSFKEKSTLSMVAAKLNARDKQVDENNTFRVNEDLTLLTNLAVYGANASGKSNLVAAIIFMRQFVLNSVREGERIPVVRYRLSTESESQPAFFEVVFQMEEKVYRYGFEVTPEKIISEWLFQQGTRKEIRLFTRDEEGIHIARAFGKAKDLVERTRANALFLSVSAQWNNEVASIVSGWFRRMRSVSGFSDKGYKGFTKEKFLDSDFRKSILEFIKALDLSIDDITSQKIEPEYKFIPDVPSELKDVIPSDFFYKAKTVHKKYDSEGNAVDAEVFDLESEESHGTQKLFYISAPIIDTLARGWVLFIDELEAYLHPMLTCEIIRMFQSPEVNPKHAQLVFTTHDTNLLSHKRFRRDQIWFAEKDRLGGSHLYSLAELKVRNDASFESDYIQGKYGAIPYIGGIKRITLENEE
jgi:AAA15 family ATPase/GTPase